MTICEECKEAAVTDIREVALKLGVRADRLEGLKLYQGRGCGRCNQTGYDGRCGLYEVLPVTPEIQELM